MADPDDAITVVDSIGEVRLPDPSRQGLLGGRWRLGDLIGRGGVGSVHRATDTATGATVAVKLLTLVSTAERARVRREIAALRILQVPGVVRLLDEGNADGHHYIVMELVEGGWFPGNLSADGWSQLAPRAVALLQALARVHAAGVFHRDLKPANVLVTPEGTVLVLDFGLARGPALGEDVTQAGTLVGTPRYLAPEQILGAEVDARTDLYAVGLMLFEQLTGRIPNTGDTLQGVMAARVSRDPIAIETLRPDLPDAAVRLVNALLRRDVNKRPRSAVAALALLGPDQSHRRLPRLGDPRPLDTLVAAALAGRCMGVEGPSGAGRTRLLRDAADRLTAEGRTVRWLRPASRPFESLSAVLGVPTDESDVATEMRTRLRERLGAGEIFVLDDPTALDRWSLHVIRQCTDAGAILGEGLERVALRPLTEEDLRPLFRGPDRLLNLRHDGAQELFRRAGGLCSRVAMEVDAWVAADLARYEGDRLRIDRNAIERLASGLRVEPAVALDEDRAELDPGLAGVLGWVAMAWPHANAPLVGDLAGMSAWEVRVMMGELEARRELRRLPDGTWEPVGGIAGATAGWTGERRRQAHAAVAAMLAPGAEGRLAHLAGADDLGGAAAEALLVGRRLVAEGQLARAMGVLEIGLGVVRQLEGAWQEEGLLVELAIAAIGLMNDEALGVARAELDRAEHSTRMVTRTSRLLAAIADARHGRPADAIDALHRLRPFDDDRLEEARLTALCRLLAADRPEEAEPFITGLAEWAAGKPHREGMTAAWLAGLRYRQERYDEAATLYAASGDLVTTEPARLAALAGVASALVESGQLEEAAIAARAVLARAGAARLPHLLARAEWILRNTAYRQGETLTVDEELLAASGEGTIQWVRAQIHMTEAAIAWRAGQGARAQELTAIATDLWARVGFHPGVTLVQALRHAVDRRAPPPELLSDALACALPGLALQCLALLALADPRLAPLVGPRVRALVVDIPEARWAVRLEVLAPTEALSYCRDAGGAV